MTVPAISDAVYVSFPTVDYSKCTEPTTLRCHSFIVGEGIVRPTTPINLPVIGHVFLA